MKKKNQESRLKKKREKEIQIIVAEISKFIKMNFSNIPLNILEFGCGGGYMTSFLQQLGNVTSVELYTHKNIKEIEQINFIQTNILKTPFKNDQFDLLFSNHVIEHISDLSVAFKELARIGKNDCLHVFSVPTSTWLLLSIPSQLYDKIKLSIKKFSQKINKKRPKSLKGPTNDIISEDKLNQSRSFLKKFYLTGHGGVYNNFFECYRKFKVESWKKLFIKNKTKEDTTYIYRARKISKKIS